jgi:ANTAR domain
MSPRTAAQAFADATSALIRDHDVTDVLSRLVRDSAELLSADAVGVLVSNSQGEVELLSSTSHDLTELELFQIQQDAGPCIECMRTTAIVAVIGTEQINARWPEVGPAIVAAGYQAVHAYPLRWHGLTIGAMNVFQSALDAAPPDELMLGQALADIATIVLVQSTDLTLQQVTDRVQQALQARTDIEQAKGVLAYRHDIDMAAAFELLRGMAAADSTLTASAAAVIADARRRDGS